MGDEESPESFQVVLYHFVAGKDIPLYQMCFLMFPL